MSDRLFNPDFRVVLGPFDIPLTSGTENDDDLSGTILDDEIYGLAGDDLIRASLGNDTLNGGDGIDTIDYSAATNPVEVYLNLRFSRSNDGWDRLNKFESVIGSSFDDHIVGQGRGILSGGAGDDTLIAGNTSFCLLLGGDGDDKIVSLRGSDTLIGGAGSDRIYGNFGNDLIDGGDGRDRLFGGGNIDTLRGGAGDDLIYGNRGNDRLYGDDGDDKLFGGHSGDDLYGGAGNDYLMGGTGTDYLEGGAGNDVLTGGHIRGVKTQGIDTFIYKDSEDGGGGFDRITDFRRLRDNIDLTSFGFAEFEDILALAEDRPTGLPLDFGQGDVLFIEDFSLDKLTIDDVLF